ncbi:MAG: hypothetical protein HYW81_03005, partial [Parcubacteria group bacterium]|nr:hypothetical protein [Parcubacteria group bacterium]
MRLPANIRMHAKKIALASVLVVAALVAIREASITRNRLPFEVTQKVRNASAQETEWQLATTAQPGDVLEHFVLIRLAEDYPEPLRGIRITAETSNAEAYREGTFASRVLGATGGSLFNKGIAVAELKPGEFIDLSWQTSIAEDASFAKNEAPILSSAVTVSANGFSELISRTVASLYSTIERSGAGRIAQETFYEPKAYSMNPRAAYEDLGTGVLIAGEDLKGITGLSVKETGRTMAWRSIGNELLEASIPAGLAPGSYAVALYDANNKPLENTLSFEILPSKGRAVVVAATPSLVRSGQRRTVVLQGIHLDENLQLVLSNRGSNQMFALENPSRINERVLFA